MLITPLTEALLAQSAFSFDIEHSQFGGLDADTPQKGWEIAERDVTPESVYKTVASF